MSGTAAAAANTPSTSTADKVAAASPHEFDPSLSEEERRFYVKAYPTVDLVKDRKVHCTVCKSHIGTAPCQEAIIKMHPVLRVTHCTKCHEFYNSGEFSKGEDGSELYCRWCGQGGEVYCCSNCPYVFCKSCIVKNLSRGVVADIEQNENWSCFNCAPKILWPLRAQHWALVNFIEKQKKEIHGMNLSESERKQQLTKDRSTCCRVVKTKLSHKSESLESLDSVASRRSHGSSSSQKKIQKTQQSTTAPSSAAGPPSKRPKTSNDEVVCTPDLLRMLEPDCQITMTYKARSAAPLPSSSTPKESIIQPPSSTDEQASASKNSTPPPLVLRNTSIQMRRVLPGQVMRRTFVGPRTPTTNSSVSVSSPVYHTINGFRIDLNSAAQQETFRLPNGKLIQVKRQASQLPPPPLTSPSPSQSGGNNWPQRYRFGPTSPVVSPMPNYTSPLAISQSNHHSSILRNMHSPAMNSSTSSSTMNTTSNGIQILNSTEIALPVPSHANAIAAATAAATATAATVANTNSSGQSLVRAQMIRHNFPDTAIGQARTQLQDQVFNAMEICQHLTGKIQTLTNSNAYKQARNYIDVKELYIHLSYLLTYAIGRFKGLQDKCLGDMRQLGFVTDADSLENGQLAAGVDYVRYGQLDDVDLFNTGSNSFHNQVYEYRKSLHAKLDNDEQHSGSDIPTAVDPLSGIHNPAMDEESLIEPMDDETIEIDDNDPEDMYMDEEPTDDGNCSVLNKAADVQHSYDRKLTRLVERYPAIWCTRHPNYGNFDVTRRHWRVISSHFKRGDNIKLRWKNLRKRYVRIERRIREGKRFTGHFDKATNFLANRNLAMNSWIDVDRGENDGDTYEYNALDSTQQREQQQPQDCEDTMDGILRSQRQALAVKNLKPIEISVVDMRIINFVKSNTVLWQKSTDPNDEQMRKSLWMHLWKSMPNIDCDDIIDRWKYLYEMYKAFRLKTIKDEHMQASLELKYSKYLAKLYFLYKIDEDVVRNESSVADDCPDLDDQIRETGKLQSMGDDKEFVQQLVLTVRQYRSLWDRRHSDYFDIVLRERLWSEVASKLNNFKRDAKSIKLRWQLARFAYQRLRRDDRCKVPEATGLLHTICKNLPTEEMSFLDIYKQASDVEDNEIEIVEPKTDTITLDSDNEEEQSTAKRNSLTTVNRADTAISTVHSVDNRNLQKPKDAQNIYPRKDNNTPYAFMSTARSILASMLDVDPEEMEETSTNMRIPPSTSNTSLKGGPRKKTTNKPNPKLLWQRKQFELNRLEDMKRLDRKRLDTKFRKKCTIKLRRVECEYPYVKELLEDVLIKQKERKVKSNENIMNPTSSISINLVGEIVNLDKSADKASSIIDTQNEVENNGCKISETEMENNKDKSTEKADINCVDNDMHLNNSKLDSENSRKSIENVDTNCVEGDMNLNDSRLCSENSRKSIERGDLNTVEDDMNLNNTELDFETSRKSIESGNGNINCVENDMTVNNSKLDTETTGNVEHKNNDVTTTTTIEQEQSIELINMNADTTNSPKIDVTNELSVVKKVTVPRPASPISSKIENDHTHLLSGFEKADSQTEDITLKVKEKDAVVHDAIIGDEQDNSSMASIRKDEENVSDTPTGNINKTDSKNVRVVDFDVNEEIEKLLQKVSDETCGKLPTDIELESVNVEIANANSQKALKSPTISTSPDLLFNDINELIEEETNAMT